jgi:hypothetical protein
VTVVDDVLVVGHGIGLHDHPRVSGISGCVRSAGRPWWSRGHSPVRHLTSTEEQTTRITSG